MEDTRQKRLFWDAMDAMDVGVHIWCFCTLIYGGFDGIPVVANGAESGCQAGCFGVGWSEEDWGLGWVRFGCWFGLECDGWDED